MARSYSNQTRTAGQTPVQWTDVVRHKYCGALDLGRANKPNKVHRCGACLAIKARQSRFRSWPEERKEGLWGAGGDEGG